MNGFGLFGVHGESCSYAIESNKAMFSLSFDIMYSLFKYAEYKAH